MHVFACASAERSLTDAEYAYDEIVIRALYKYIPIQYDNTEEITVAVLAKRHVLSLPPWI